MKAFGFLSFGHYGHGRGPGDPDAGQALKDAVEIAVGADEIGVNGAYWRVHHYARQAAPPGPPGFMKRVPWRAEPVAGCFFIAISMVCPPGWE